jgi:hypothetical protein
MGGGIYEGFPNFVWINGEMRRSWGGILEVSLLDVNGMKYLFKLDELVWRFYSYIVMVDAVNI